MVSDLPEGEVLVMGRWKDLLLVLGIALVLWIVVGLLITRVFWPWIAEMQGVN